MKSTLASGLCCVAAGIALAGCITHEETVYKDVERTPVSFENDTAARLFYEKLSQPSHRHSGNESRTEIKLPLVFKDERKVISGANGSFNKAVALCDTNRDGRITEQEARIFAGQP